jgi:hypothetical protein
MSDHDDRTGTPDPDELVSAVLDGEATPAERAQVLADPELRRRLQEFEAVAAAVADAAPVDPSVRDVTVARALADDPDGDAAHAPHRVAAAPLDRTGSRTVRLAPWLAAAAVLALVIPVGLALLRGGGSDDQFAATQNADSGDAEAPGGGGTPPSGEDRSAEASGDGLAGEGELVDLGDLSSPDELRAAAAALVEGNQHFSARSGRAELEAASPHAGDRLSHRLTPEDPSACEASLRAAAPDLGPALEVATASYEFAPAFVFVFAATDATAETTVIAVARSGCRELARTPS